MKSTSPTNGPCGEDDATQPRSNELTGYAAAFYCPAGTTSRMAVSENFHTTPITASTSARTWQSECLGTEVTCKNGVRYENTGWKVGCKLQVFCF